MEPWQQQSLAVASFALSLLMLLSFISAGWIILWHTTLKDIGFFREIMGLNRPKPEVKAKRQASMQAEIEKIKKQHSRGHRAMVQRVLQMCTWPVLPNAQSEQRWHRAVVATGLAVSLLQPADQGTRSSRSSRAADHLRGPLVTPSWQLPRQQRAARPTGAVYTATLGCLRQHIAQQRSLPSRCAASMVFRASMLPSGLPGHAAISRLAAAARQQQLITPAIFSKVTGSSLHGQAAHESGACTHHA